MYRIPDPSLFRANICAKLNDIICDKDLSQAVETGLLNYTDDEANARKIVKLWTNSPYVQIYVDRCRSVYYNLKNPDNPALLLRLQTGDIQPLTLAYLTHQDLFPEQWAELIDSKHKRDLSKYDSKQQASTDLFTCRKCKTNNCTYYELQTRSADESMTVFITCLDCGTKWRQS